MPANLIRSMTPTPESVLIFLFGDAFFEIFPHKSANEKTCLHFYLWEIKKKKTRVFACRVDIVMTHIKFPCQ